MKKNQTKTNPESKLTKLSLEELSNVAGSTLLPTGFVWKITGGCKLCNTEGKDM